MGRFKSWLSNNPERVVLEKKGRLIWTPKAKIIFALAYFFNIFTFGRKPAGALQAAVRFFTPFDFVFKKLMVYRAAAKRNKMALSVIGITGSYGKTTTKDALAHILAPKYRVVKTEGNYNTLLGVAKTILSELRPEHEIFVCEMAAYRPGDIRAIAGLARPGIGIITAIGPMHLERFGNEKNILKTKLELIESLPESGTGFLPKALSAEIGDKKFRAKIVFFDSKEDLLFKAGELFGMTEDEIKDELKTAPPTPHRRQITKTSAGITIIDDTYNSNPAGFMSALKLLSETPAERRILVTPGMIELGQKQFELNKEMAKTAAKIADYAVIVGEINKKALGDGLKEIYGGDYASKVFEAPDLEAAKSKLSELTIPNSAVLLENDLPDHYF